MSTEPKPDHKEVHIKEQLETSALGHSLVSTWEKFKQGKLISYKMMGVILLAATAIGVTAYIISEQRRGKSQLWVELEGANSLSALEEFAKAHPDTPAGRVAEMSRARVLMGPEGIDRLPTARDEGERKRAIENIDKARELMEKLIEQFKDDPVLKLECLMGMAKSEATLIGITKEGTTEIKGSPDKMIEWLDKIGELADGTPWGDEAKKLSAALKSGPKRDELIHVQRSLLMQGLPGGGGPVAPAGGPGLGGFPGFGGLPGLTGGGPIAPLPTPPITPTPTPTPPSPVPPVPKPPESKPPEIKAPDPKAPPPKAPDPKPPEPPKK